MASMVGTRPPTTGQAVVGTSMLVLRGQNPYRAGVVISNVGSNVGYIGFTPNVSATNGYGIPPNGYVVVTHPAAIYAISATTGTTLTFYEESNG